LVKDELSAEQLNTALKQAGEFSLVELSKIIEILLQTLYDMKRSSFPQINMELAVVEVCNR